MLSVREKEHAEVDSLQEVAASPIIDASAATTKTAGRLRRKALVLNFDGASKNNPGDAGAGWVLLDASNGSSLAFGWKYLGNHNTNNEAEYTGLLEGLTYVSAFINDAERIDIKGDSNLVVQQVLGNWKCRSANLIPYYSKARTLYNSLKRQNSRLNLMYVPREENPVADGLSNLAVKLRTAKIFEDINEQVDVEYLKARFG